ncbi:hemin ABC transporter substrate-binding protein [Phreatobacter aquaticus]|uniref:Hemin ABC transporter substrate-binding protein n=1 Tax=Phreatobacter aquaticus TaxID=2570229 RepID=A0A4D7QMS7_9HYPH|nr:ABC transporter substrate-binding protein [Phreatobacter aquaticus]QCK86929.1 hemin ABC transporter substrate-binding protein [Phreatobacter aquaticus]
MTAVPVLTRRHLLAAAATLAAPLPALAADEQRIVAAGGVITEILYALGLGDRLVGVDSTSLFPADALKDKPNVGYVRQLSAEGILSLRPSLVIAVEGAGPPDALKLVAEAGVKVERLAEDLSEQGIVQRIRAVGRLAGAGDRAEALGNAVEAHFAALKLERDRIASRKRILFVLSLQNGRATVGGRNSSADAIIRLAGGINAADNVEGYKPMTDEGIIAAAPDVVLVMARGGDHALSAADVFRLPAFSATPAAAAAKLVAMDPLYLLGFGPRTPEAARDLMVAVR